MTPGFFGASGFAIVSAISWFPFLSRLAEARCNDAGTNDRGFRTDADTRGRFRLAPREGDMEGHGLAQGIG